MASSNVMHLRCEKDTGERPREHLCVLVRLPLDIAAVGAIAKHLGRCPCGAQTFMRPHAPHDFDAPVTEGA